MDVNKYTIGASIAGVCNTVAAWISLYVYKPTAQDPYFGKLLADIPGLALMGGVPVYLCLRYRLVTPLALSGLLTTLNLTARGIANIYVNPFMPFYTLGIAVVLAVIEYYIREWMPYISHDPLV
ncbi:hypothetical protein [Halomicrobium sp. LC1Hm]|uniref:hypothetical protein n=1 Tax=Halomicrobium sp. LC1Hm TaxID=2610902 RepID=UPI001298344D|nr:hypothetical protein [Halomicrobium sp. LC1Hm]